MTEAFALSCGLKWCLEHRIRRIWVEANSLLVVNVDKQVAKPSWQYEPIIEKHKELIHKSR